jgi:hypothetical protein
MLKNSNNHSDIEAGITRGRRPFREVSLTKLFKKNYEYEGFYSGEKVDLTDEENSNSTRIKEVRLEEIRKGETETLGTVPTIEVSTITPPIVLEALSNQGNQSSQSSQSTITSSLVHTQSRNQGRSMVDEMRLPIFRGDGSEDPDQHRFLCEDVWSIK